MKIKSRNITMVLALLALATLNFQLSTCFAQGTAFTYQGQLQNNGGSASGTYNLTFSLYTTNITGVPVAGPVTTNGVIITNGLFTVTIDFGSAVWNGATNWLQIGVETNGIGSFTTLTPRQQLSPVPYAIYAESANAAGISGTIPAANLGGTYSGAVNFNNGANSFDGSFYGDFYGATFTGGNFVGNFVGTGSSLTDIWHTEGNSGTTAGTDFVGTTDNQPLELHVDGLRALRLEPDTTGSGAPNVIGGSPANVMDAGGVIGGFIGGGGAVNFNGAGYTNRVSAYFGSIVGGYGNWIQAYGNGALIGGGYFNTVQNGAGLSVIGGGQSNTIQTNAQGSVIGGGYGNKINYTAAYGATASTIGGGENNVAAGNLTTVAGGYGNQANNVNATVGGGYGNIASGYNATISGGLDNTASGSGAFIGGGGGDGHSVFVGHQASGTMSTIGGGLAQTAAADYSSILGGADNGIQSYASYSTIGGGQLNNIQIYSANATIAGGNGNVIQTNNYASTIGGGVGNQIQSSTDGGTVAASTIGGGSDNLIETNAVYGTIAGGIGNQIGYQLATIGGGAYNTNIGYLGTIPGGYENYVAGEFSLAAGNRAQAAYPGDFVWADSQNASFAATTSDQFSVRAQGGVRFVTGGAGMTLDGQPVLSGASFWSATGNAGTTPGVNFIGTTDNRALLIRGSFVGVGRTTPVSSAEYFGVEAPATSGSYGGMYVDTSNTGAKPFYGYSLAGTATAWTYVDGADANKWKLNVSGDRLTVTTAGNVGIGNTSPGNLLTVGTGGAYCNGTTWVNGSDRSTKQDFAAINPGEVLQKVAALPITEWQYKVEADGVKHLGPMAQDFHAAFGLNGGDDKHISTVDEGGVALAAIQGLNQKVEAQQAELSQKETEVTELKQRLAALEKIVLNQKPN